MACPTAPSDASLFVRAMNLGERSERGEGGEGGEGEKKGGNCFFIFYKILKFYVMLSGTRR